MQNILIVDDVIVNRKLIKTILVQAKMDVHIYEAANGLEALEIVKEKPFSVIILDIMMPEMDGLQVLQEIKSMPQHKDTCVIICSAVHEIDSIEKALAMGALDYFTKPLTVEQIRITLPLKIKNALEFYAQNMQLIKYNRLFKEEMQLAEELQKSMILEYSEFPEGTLYGKYVPCAAIGGDMFATKQVKNRLWFMIADISGHGVAAAMMSTMLKVIFNNNISDSVSPNEILEKINDTLHDVFEGSKAPLITAFLGYIEGDAIYYANAGHPYPIVYRAGTGVVEELEQTGFLLGMFENTQYVTLQSALQKNDLLLLYTDGLYDVGKEYSTQNVISVKEYCVQNKSALENSLKTFIDEITAFFQKQDMNGFDDDVAVMAIKKSV